MSSNRAGSNQRAVLGFGELDLVLRGQAIDVAVEACDLAAGNGINAALNRVAEYNRGRNEAAEDSDD